MNLENHAIYEIKSNDLQIILPHLVDSKAEMVIFYLSQL